MIIAKCPLRVSIAGGSTDLQDFIEKNGYGCVISFPSTLYAYITIHKNNRKKYIIDYSIREEEEDVNNIKNDIAREVLKLFPCEPVTMTFNTDAHSSGTGLASSSAYTIAAIAALSKFLGLRLSNYEICKLSLEIERKFNPHTGYQDPYGCGIGSFKKMEFFKNEELKITYLKNSFFDKFDIKLLYSGITRNSTTILKKIINDDRQNILQDVQLIEESIFKNDYEHFFSLINSGWQNKKKNSPHIINDRIREIDEELCKNKKIYAHRLCGAGNGGYFLLITDKSATINCAINISIDQNGVQVYEI